MMPILMIYNANEDSNQASQEEQENIKFPFSCMKKKITY